MVRRKTQPAWRKTRTVARISPAKSISNSAGWVSRRWVSQRLNSLNQRPTIASGWRRVESESARGEQRERGLEHREREPVDEVDDEHPPDVRPAHQPGQVTERI